jgi:hypothetical protein
LVDLSSSNPIRWRPCADPVQKRDPGERITQKGLTNGSPLQKQPLSGVLRKLVGPDGLEDGIVLAAVKAWPGEKECEVTAERRPSLTASARDAVAMTRSGRRNGP